MKKGLIYILLCLTTLFVVAEVYARFFKSYCEPWFDKKTKIIKRKKNTEGIYETKYCNTGYYKINNEGWNSHRDYFINRLSNDNNSNYPKIRIAIVGHSNIEGLRIPIEKTLSKVLEDELIKKGKNVEIYTFGYGGMHLAQALHVSRYVIQEFHPDVLIIGTLIDNFLYETTNVKHFLSLNIDSKEQISEILPKNYGSPLSFLYFSKAVKYVDIRFNVGKRIKNLISMNVGKNNGSNQNHYVLKQYPHYEKKVLLGMDYIFKEFNNIVSVSEPHVKIFIMDFPLNYASYNNFNSVNMSKTINYHQNILNLIDKYDIPVINMENSFIDDYKKNHIKFDYPNDGHYNEHTHQLIGKSLSDYLIDNNIFFDTK